MVIYWTEVILNPSRQKPKYYISMSYSEVFLPCPTPSSIIDYNILLSPGLAFPQPARNSPGVPWLWVPLSSWESPMQTRLHLHSLMQCPL